jgi:hypothetical protein
MPKIGEAVGRLLVIGAKGLLGEARGLLEGLEGFALAAAV